MSLKLIDAFLEMIVAERGAAINTVTAYRQDLKELYNFLYGKKVRLQNASREHLTAYISFLRGTRLSAKTQSRRLCAMREFYRFLYSEDIIKKNPTDYIQAPKIHQAQNFLFRSHLQLRHLPSILMQERCKPESLQENF